MIYAILTLGVSALCFYAARHTTRATREARRWRTTEGRVLERGVGQALGDHLYAPHVKYTYTVAGTTYTNDQVYVVRGTGALADKVQALVDALPAVLPVHYDPKDPRRSYLLMNPMSTVWVLRVFGGVTLIVGLLMLLIALLRPTG